MSGEDKRPTEWRSSAYGHIYGTGEAYFQDETTDIVIKTTYNHRSPFRPGQTVTFTMQCTRNSEFCFAQSIGTGYQKLLVVIPLNETLGSYRSVLPDDNGTMNFDRQWIEQIKDRIPDTNAERPPNPTTTFREELSFVCSLGCLLL